MIESECKKLKLFIYQEDCWAVRRSYDTLSQIVDFFPAGFFPYHWVRDYFNFEGFSNSKG
jgi:hypothetical protein